MLVFLYNFFKFKSKKEKNILIYDNICKKEVGKVFHEKIDELYN